MKIRLKSKQNHNQIKYLKYLRIIRIKDVEEARKFYNSEYLHMRNGYDETLLHIATKWSSIDIVKFLLSKGIQVNAADCRGFTPLHSAVITCQTHKALILIQHGGDGYLKNKFHESPLEIAKIKNLTEIVKIIEQKAQVKRRSKNNAEYRLNKTSSFAGMKYTEPSHDPIIPLQTNELQSPPVTDEQQDYSRISMVTNSTISINSVIDMSSYFNNNNNITTNSNISMVTDDDDQVANLVNEEFDEKEDTNSSGIHSPTNTFDSSKVNSPNSDRKQNKLVGTLTKWSPFGRIMMSEEEKLREICDISELKLENEKLREDNKHLREWNKQLLQDNLELFEKLRAK